MRQWRWIAASAIAVAISACGGSSGSSTGPNSSPNKPGGGGSTANTNEVTLLAQSFSPSSITVPVGTTVTWLWQACDASGGGYGGGNPCVTHDITFDDGSNISSAPQSSGSFTRNFTTAGVFKYHCAVHGAAIMSGQVTVQ